MSRIYVVVVLRFRNGIVVTMDPTTPAKAARIVRAMEGNPAVESWGQYEAETYREHAAMPVNRTLRPTPGPRDRAARRAAQRQLALNGNSRLTC